MQIDPTLDSGSWLNSLDDIGVKPTLATQVFARRILNRQLPDGHWGTIDVRPPQSYSVVTATAVAVPRHPAVSAGVDGRRAARRNRSRPCVAAEGRAGGYRRAHAAAAGPVVARGGAGTRLNRRCARWSPRSAPTAAGRSCHAWEATPTRRVRRWWRCNERAASTPAIRRCGADWRICCRNSARTAPGWSRHDCTNRTWSALRISRPAFLMARIRSSRRWARRGRRWRCSSRCRCACPMPTVLDGLPVDTPAEQPWMQTALFGTTEGTRGAAGPGPECQQSDAGGHDGVDDGGARCGQGRAAARAWRGCLGAVRCATQRLDGLGQPPGLARRDAAAPGQGRLAGGAAGACRIAQASLADALRDLVR